MVRGLEKNKLRKIQISHFFIWVGKNFLRSSATVKIFNAAK